MRLRDIDRQLELMASHLGPQGHTLTSYGHVLLDPMRRVDELVDATADLDVERAALVADLQDAQALCKGVARCLSRTLGRILELAFIEGWAADTTADYLDLDAELVERAVDCTPSELDPLVPHLMRAGR